MSVSSFSINAGMLPYLAMRVSRHTEVPAAATSPGSSVSPGDGERVRVEQPPPTVHRTQSSGGSAHLAAVAGGSSTPEDAIRAAQQLRSAALAACPSTASDNAIAALATAIEQSAQQALLEAAKSGDELAPCSEPTTASVEAYQRASMPAAPRQEAPADPMYA